MKAKYRIIPSIFCRPSRIERFCCSLTNSWWQTESIHWSTARAKKHALAHGITVED